MLHVFIENVTNSLYEGILENYLPEINRIRKRNKIEIILSIKT